MKTMDKNQAGMALGILYGLMHLAWVVLVLVGLGGISERLVADFHFVKGLMPVDSFELGTAIVGLILAFVIGYLTGWVFAWIWNRVGKK